MSDLRIGGLVLVSTPIGNLGDLSPRAVDTLAGVDIVACEDTRRTGRLLQHVGVEGARLLRVDAHTEDRAAARIVAHLDEGRTVAMVTDAGTPGISDPGERLVRRVIQAGHRVSVVPGPVAPVAALVASGMPTDRWCMEGFLPRKGVARAERIAELAAEERTVIILESPRRLVATLSDLARALDGDRPVAVARELTKRHEEVWRGTLATAVERYTEAPKGEVVVVLAGSPPAAEANDKRILTVIDEARRGGASTRDAADEAARRLGVSRRRSYRLALGD